MDKNVVLDVKNLHVHYVTDDATAKAVNGIDFQVKEGEALGLVGETGAGKTTTALSIMQLIPDPPGMIVDGEIYFEGKNVILNTDKENQAMRGNGVAMIFQDPMTALNPVMTVGEQLSEVVLNHEKVSKAEAKKRVIDLLEIVGVKSDRYDDYPHQFSGGQLIICLGNDSIGNTILADHQCCIKAIGLCTQLGVLLGAYIFASPGAMVLGGLFAMLGHIFPLFLGFRGGKGVATGLGVIAALMPSITAIIVIVWLVLVLLTRYVSVGSIVASVLAPILAACFKVPDEFFAFALAAAAVIVWRHRDNIIRLKAGRENKF